MPIQLYALSLLSCQGRGLSGRYPIQLGVVDNYPIQSPTLLNFFVSTFPQSDDFLISFYIDDFTVSRSNFNAEALSAYSPNTEWADERSLVIAAPKPTITLFTPQIAQSSTHPQVTLNYSILPPERTFCILGVTFDPPFKFNVHVKSLVTRALPLINILKAPTGTNWGQQNETILITYISYSVPFHVCSSHLVSKHLTIPYSEIPSNPKLCLPYSHRRL